MPVTTPRTPDSGRHVPPGNCAGAGAAGAFAAAFSGAASLAEILQLGALFLLPLQALLTGIILSRHLGDRSED